MSITCVWNVSCSVSDREMDLQHQQLLKRVSAMPTVLDADQIRIVVNGIREYAQAHFADEERYMRSLGYPRLAEHHEVHEELIACLDEIVARPRVRGNAPFSLRELLLDWFMGHILAFDLDYARFANAQPFGSANRLGGVAQARRLSVEKKESGLDISPLSDEEMENF